MTQARVTISGYYGFGNAGDEAVLAGLVQSLRARRGPDELEIVALSGSPEETRTQHGIEAAHRYQASALLGSISKTDLLLSGGGSLLQDVTSAHGIFYYLGVVRLAQMLGKKTMFVAQGIGPLKLARSRRLVRSVANRLDALTVRDETSASLLREIGVKKPAIEVTADPALLLTPAGDQPLKPEGFGVALRPWPGHEALAFYVADACRFVLAANRALLFPMQPKSDGETGEHFAAQWHQVNRVVLCSTQNGLPALLHNIGGCQMMVGMRLHALILATACGVPSVALSYDPKVSAFMEQSGQGDAVYSLDLADPAALSNLLGKVWADRSNRAAALRERLPALRAQAARNAEAALSLLA